jgi:hypothetical protein
MTEISPFQRPSNALPRGCPHTPLIPPAVGRPLEGRPPDGVAAMEKHFSRVKGISDGQ